MDRTLLAARLPNDAERFAYVTALTPHSLRAELTEALNRTLDKLPPDVRKTSLVLQALEGRLHSALSIDDIFALRTHPHMDAHPTVQNVLCDYDPEFLNRSVVFHTRLAG